MPKKKNEQQKILVMKKASRNEFGIFIENYFEHYQTSPTPPFHWQIYEDLEREDVNFIELIAFRGSAKSTIASLAFPIFCAVTDRKKFILLLSDSFSQAKIHISNIIHELESNEALIRDFGPFQGSEEWTATNIVMQNGARIMSRSRGQKVRGLRHLQYRPDLVIADDVENSESVRTKEQRDKTAEWFLSEVVPALDNKKGKMILIGNLLHSDSLVSKQKQLITDQGIGVLKEYSLMHEGKCLWPERFSEEEIKILKIKSGTRFFQREYLLKLVPEEGQIINKVHYYTKLPKVVSIGIGVDPAISQKQTADYAAINTIAKCEDNNFYNLRNEADRWGWNGTLEKINQTYTDFKNAHPGIPIYLGFEDVAYQKAAIEEFHRRYSIKPQEIMPIFLLLHLIPAFFIAVSKVSFSFFQR